jgi:membrane protein DedA with SNARE-associated domain
VVYLVIGALAAIENIIPPVPADTAVALGAFLSQGGVISAWTVFLITWVANVTTATAVFFAGRTLGRSFFAGRLGRRLLDPRRLARLEELYARHGTWGIFVSRFVPGVRAVVPPFAGVARLGVGRFLGAMIVASGIWYGTLTYLAATAVRQLDQIAALLKGLNRFALGTALAIAVVAAAWYLWRRRSARAPGP